MTIFIGIVTVAVIGLLPIIFSTIYDQQFLRQLERQDKQQWNEYQRCNIISRIVDKRKQLEENDTNE